MSKCYITCFLKSDIKIRKTNFSIIVKLVERNPCPNGFQLVDPDKSGKKNQFDLVELAANIQTVSSFYSFTNYLDTKYVMIYYVI